MKRKLSEHLISIILVTLVLSIPLFTLLDNGKQTGHQNDRKAEAYLQPPYLDLNDPFDRALFHDVLDIYRPQQTAANDSLIQSLKSRSEQHLARQLAPGFGDKGLTFSQLRSLLGMYVKFVLIYGLVLLLTYYGVQTLGIWRFVRKKQKRTPNTMRFFRHVVRPPALQKTEMRQWYHYIKRSILLAVKMLGTALAYLILFSPAYVIAYSFKTRFDTDSIFFMIILGVISNGLLLNYAHKFYTFLVTESRKGYVETALIKNLNNSYDHASKGGIRLKQIFALHKRFEGHVFQHIFMNARYQYLPAIKEQASFLISGLIIIEMALNIHGHLTYELLQQLLYENFAAVIVIILGIFYVVKATEIGTDWIVHRETMRYENR